MTLPKKNKAHYSFYDEIFDAKLFIDVSRMKSNTDKKCQTIEKWLR